MELFELVASFFFFHRFHFLQEEGGAGMMMRAPPSHDPSCYEFGFRYAPGKGNTMSATARSGKLYFVLI
jgi:hypothetical protein